MDAASAPNVAAEQCLLRAARMESQIHDPKQAQDLAQMPNHKDAPGCRTAACPKDTINGMASAPVALTLAGRCR